MPVPHHSIPFRLISGELVSVRPVLIPGYERHQFFYIYHDEDEQMYYILESNTHRRLSMGSCEQSAISNATKELRKYYHGKHPILIEAVRILSRDKSSVIGKSVAEINALIAGGNTIVAITNMSERFVIDKARHHDGNKGNADNHGRGHEVALGKDGKGGGATQSNEGGRKMVSKREYHRKGKRNEEERASYQVMCAASQKWYGNGEIISLGKKATQK